MAATPSQSGAQQALLQLVQQRGAWLASDPTSLRTMLGQETANRPDINQRDVAALVALAESQAAAVVAQDRVGAEQLAASAAARQGLTPEEATWALDAWSEAVGATAPGSAPTTASAPPPATPPTVPLAPGSLAGGVQPPPAYQPPAPAQPAYEPPPSPPPAYEPPAAAPGYPPVAPGTAPGYGQPSGAPGTPAGYDQGAASGQGAGYDQGPGYAQPGYGTPGGPPPAAGGPTGYGAGYGATAAAGYQAGPPPGPGGPGGPPAYGPPGAPGAPPAKSGGNGKLLALIAIPVAVVLLIVVGVVVAVSRGGDTPLDVAGTTLPTISTPPSSTAAPTTRKPTTTTTESTTTTVKKTTTTMAPWSTYVPSDGTFLIDFPGTPEAKTSTISVLDKPATQKTYRLQSSTDFFQLEQLELPQGVYVKDKEALLNSFASTALAQQFGTLKSQDKSDFAGNPAILLSFQQGAVETKVFLLIAGNRIYTMAAAGLFTSDFDRFRNSFHIT